MRRVTIAAAAGAALVAGTSPAAAPQEPPGRIVFVSERAPDLGRTRFAALALSGAAQELGFAPPGAALARDGATYAAGRGRELLVGTLRGLEPRVVAVAPFEIADIAWSPNRTQIAFTVVDPTTCAPGYKLCVTYRLFVVDAAGGAPRKLADRARHPVWSPNGRWIAYAGEWNTYDANDSGASGTPYVVRPDGSGMRRLVRVRGVRSLAWSPRSDRLAVATVTRIVALVPLAGRASRLGTGAVVAWSPSNRIASADRSSIVVRRPDGRVTHHVRSPADQIYALAWSPRGDLSHAGYVPGNYPASRIVAVTTLGRRTSVLLTTEPSQEAVLAGWRADRLLVATVRLVGGDTDVYTMRADGGDVRPVTKTGEFEFAPTASPDGFRIAFTSIRRGGYPQSAVFAIDTSSGARTQLTTPPPGTDDHDPAWSPVGDTIAFVRSHAAEGRDQTDLFVVGPAGGGERQLTQLGGTVRGPTWSPDGTRIAFGRYIGWHGAVAVVNADGSAYRELTTAYGSPLPAWSPDGARLAFVNPRSGGIVLYAVASGAVSELPARADTRSAQAWSPDSSRVVYLATDGDLHSVGVDGAGDVRLTPEPGLDLDPDWSRAAP